MKPTFTRGLVASSVLAGAIGGLMFDSHRYVAVLLIAAGIVGTLFAYLSSEGKQDEEDAFAEATARLLVGLGAGNPSTILVKNLLLKGAPRHEVLSRLEKALGIDPNDADALLIYVTVSALDLSLERSIAPGNELTNLKRHQRAMELVGRGISCGKHLSSFFALKGMLLDEIRRHDDARQCYLRSRNLRSDPFHAASTLPILPPIRRSWP